MQDMEIQNGAKLTVRESQMAAFVNEGEVAERLYFAHSDLSGLSLFEEAQYRGVQAADRALAALTGH